MTEGPSTERVCVHCGTPRPTDVPTCPACGKPWVDEPVSAITPPPPAPTDAADEAPEPSEAPDDAATGAAVAGAAAAGLDDTGEFSFDDWTMPPERPASKAKWIIPIILLIAAAIVWALVFLDTGSTTSTTVAAPTTTTMPATTTTSPATTTTAGETTTTVATTTTIPYPPPSNWAPVGEPIPTEELSLRAAGIGPLEFGSPVEEIAGRLTASLGEAEAATDQDLCPPDEAYALQWGELLAIFDGYEADSVFVSYRYQDIGSDTELGLTTLSGLALGDTVGDLKRIYSQFTIAFETIDGVDHFRLSEGGELLLWGPVSATTDDGIVEGIYSPTPCDG